MISSEEADKRIAAAMPPWPAEDCPLGRAHGRVLRAEIAADRDMPPFDRATRDGYALRASALAAGFRRFRVEAVQAAGAPASALGPAPDACVEIMTGAVVPAGADCVVPYEDASRDVETVALPPGRVFRPGHAVHRRGADRRAGAVIVPAGVRLSGREIAVAAACGRAALPVSRLPRIAVAATGDELVEVGTEVAPHQIRRSNDHALRAALDHAGFPGAERFHVRDDPDRIDELLGKLLGEFDVAILVGGVSKGRFDHLPAGLERRCVRPIFHGVAQQPGRPLWFGIGPSRVPVFALPGNPVSAYVCLHRYVLPALRRASGLAESRPLTAALAGPAGPTPGLTWFVPVRVSSGPRAELLAEPVLLGTSGDLSGLAGTDGFVELPAGPREFPEGALAPFRPWA